MAVSDAVTQLRRFQEAGPWSLPELAGLTDELLDAAAAPPEKATSERTVRFYVSRGVVAAPYGRGGGTTWGYRHLIELLAARLAQHDGDTLETIAARRGTLGERTMERQVAERLAVAFRPRLVREAPPPPEPVATTAWRRIVLAEGVELHVAEGHPVLGDEAKLRRIAEMFGE